MKREKMCGRERVCGRESVYGRERVCVMCCVMYLMCSVLHNMGFGNTVSSWVVMPVKIIKVNWIKMNQIKLNSKRQKDFDIYVSISTSKMKWNEMLIKKTAGLYQSERRVFPEGECEHCSDHILMTYEKWGVRTSISQLMLLNKQLRDTQSSYLGKWKIHVWEYHSSYLGSVKLLCGKFKDHNGDQDHVVK